MIFRFFDYVFYVVYKAYSQSSETAPEGVASGIISVLQVLNIYSCFFLYELITQNEININKYIGGGLIFILMVFNYFRYIRKDYFELLKKKWAKEFSKRNDPFIWMYIIFSVVGCFGLAIYLGNQR